MRSLCTVVCKWCYDANADGSGLGWDRTFFREIGFEEDELTPTTIGEIVRDPGTPVTGGLGEQAARELGQDPRRWFEYDARLEP